MKNHLHILIFLFLTIILAACPVAEKPDDKGNGNQENGVTSVTLTSDKQIAALSVKIKSSASLKSTTSHHTDGLAYAHKTGDTIHVGYVASAAHSGKMVKVDFATGAAATIQSTKAYDIDGKEVQVTITTASQETTAEAFSEEVQLQAFVGQSITVKPALDKDFANYPLGDADASGAVGIVDALTTLKLAKKVVEPSSDKQAYHADINGDGKISADDALQVLKKAINTNLAAKLVLAPRRLSLQGGNQALVLVGNAGQGKLTSLTHSNVAGITLREVSGASAFGKAFEVVAANDARTSNKLEFSALNSKVSLDVAVSQLKFEEVTVSPDKEVTWTAPTKETITFPASSNSSSTFRIAVNPEARNVLDSEGDIYTNSIELIINQTAQFANKAQIMIELPLNSEASANELETAVLVWTVLLEGTRERIHLYGNYTVEGGILKSTMDASAFFEKVSKAAQVLNANTSNINTQAIITGVRISGQLASIDKYKPKGFEGLYRVDKTNLAYRWHNRDKPNSLCSKELAYDKGTASLLEKNGLNAVYPLPSSDNVDTAIIMIHGWQTLVATRVRLGLVPIPPIIGLVPIIGDTVGNNVFCRDLFNVTLKLSIAKDYFQDGKTQALSSNSYKGLQAKYEIIDNRSDTFYFRYDSDHRIERNGELLAAYLENLAHYDNVIIVAHSMGGLVTAEAVKRLMSKAKRTGDPKYANFIDKVITLSTPFMGGSIYCTQKGTSYCHSITGFEAFYPSGGTLDLATIYGRLSNPYLERLWYEGEIGREEILSKFFSIFGASALPGFSKCLDAGNFLAYDPFLGFGDGPVSTSSAMAFIKADKTVAAYMGLDTSLLKQGITANKNYLQKRIEGYRQIGSKYGTMPFIGVLPLARDHGTIVQGCGYDTELFGSIANILLSFTINPHKDKLLFRNNRAQRIPIFVELVKEATSSVEKLQSVHTLYDTKYDLILEKPVAGVSIKREGQNIWIEYDPRAPKTDQSRDYRVSFNYAIKSYGTTSKFAQVQLRVQNKAPHRLLHEGLPKGAIPQYEVTYEDGTKEVIEQDDKFYLDYSKKYKIRAYGWKNYIPESISIQGTAPKCIKEPLYYECEFVFSTSTSIYRQSKDDDYIMVQTKYKSTPPQGPLLVSPSIGVSPLDVKIDASHAGLNLGNILLYEYEFGDATPVLSTVAPRSVVYHTYKKVGAYQVKVTVEDDKGKKATYHKLVRVVDPNAETILDISAGGFHSLALKANGTVGANGWNRYNQATVSSALNDAIAIAAGGYHSMVLRSNGKVVAWGRNVDNQASVPSTLNDVSAVAAGTYHSLALKKNGLVNAWGRNTSGQTNVPTTLNNVIAVAAGGFHSLALKRDGTVVAWGDNSKGQSTVPSGLKDVVAIAAGGFHSLALKRDGTIVAWGDNSQKQTAVPSGLRDVVAIATGGYHSLALKRDGTVVAWGRNVEGQTDVPTNLQNITAISAGAIHSLVLDVDGKVTLFGTFTPADASNVPLSDDQALQSLYAE